MGFDTRLFVDQPVNENYICTICYEVLEKPTTSCRRGHAFCSDCITEWSNRSLRCPSCRQAMLRETILCRNLQSIIMDLQVHCPQTFAESTHSTLQCSWVGSLSSYQNAHSFCDCSFLVKIPCPLCKNVIPWTEMSVHVESLCSKRAACCPLCGKRVPWPNLKGHLDQCLVACPWCTKRVPWREINGHAKQQCLKGFGPKWELIWKIPRPVALYFPLVPLVVGSYLIYKAFGGLGMPAALLYGVFVSNYFGRQVWANCMSEHQRVELQQHYSRCIERIRATSSS